jgi:hypothetical protein
MPYTEDLILSASPIYHEGSDMWLTQILLHCFDIIEMHYPDQVIQ